MEIQLIKTEKDHQKALHVTGNYKWTEIGK